MMTITERISTRRTAPVLPDVVIRPALPSSPRYAMHFHGPIVPDPGFPAIERGIGAPQKLVRRNREISETHQHWAIPLGQQSVGSGAPHQSRLPRTGVGVHPLHLPHLAFRVVSAIGPR